MADNNTEKDQKPKKRHKWMGIFLIALLLLFIGLTGYYLERDLEPVPDNQITENGASENGTSENGASENGAADNSDEISDSNNLQELDSSSDESTVENGDETVTEAENNGLGDQKDAADGQNSINDREEAAENQNEFTQELEEDPSLLDRVLSILGLSESDFAQNLNILFVGLDDEESVEFGSIEADSIMLARLRPEADKLQLEHIDEDREYQGQLLRKYYNGDMQLAVEDITETEVDYYVYVNYQGFEKVIDELGGVKINLKEAVRVPDLGLNLKAGDNLLAGKEALNFVRWRDSNSMSRFQRQKILINAVMEKLKSNNILFNVQDLYNTMVESYNSIETDISPVLAAEIFNYIRDNDNLQLEFID